MNLSRSDYENRFARTIVPYLSLKGLIGGVSLAWGVRILFPDCTMCGHPGYALVMEIFFHYEDIPGLLLLLIGLATIYTVERPHGRWADEVNTLFCVGVFFIWPLIALSLLWGDAQSLGTLTYAIFGLAALAVFVFGPSRA